MTQSSKEFKVYGYRWAVLLVFGLVFMMSQLTWLAFSLIPNEVAPVFGITDTSMIIFLTASQPLVFIILSIPVGMLADRKGLRIVAGAGSVIVTIFAALRIFLIDDFMMIFLCQIGLSVGAVLIQDCITYLSAHWFPRAERTLATGVSTVFQLLGMLIGSIMSLLLWVVPFWGGSYSAAAARGNVVSILTIQAVLSVIFMVLFFIVGKDRPKLPPEIEEVTTKKPSVMRMLRDRSPWIISYGFFAGFAVVIGLTGILENLLISLGVVEVPGISNPVVITQTLILASGIVGAFVISAISDKVQRRKPFLLLASVIGAITTLLLGISPFSMLTYVIAVLLGFFLISVMPVALTTTEELKSVGPQLSGASAGLIFEFANLGGFLGLLILEYVLKDPTAVQPYFYSILFLFAALLIAGALFLLVPETGKREKAKKK
ncbi:MAG: MFS transporter [Promethearchaeati archaeon SRVP18_Atabeyarchaeia-1]